MRSNRLLSGMTKVVIVGGRGEAADLVRAAHSAYAPGKIVLALDPADAAQRERIEGMGYAAAREPTAYVCRGTSCLAPARTAGEVKGLIEANGS